MGSEKAFRQNTVEFKGLQMAGHRSVVTGRAYCWGLRLTFCFLLLLTGRFVLTSQQKQSVTSVSFINFMAILRFELLADNKCPVPLIQFTLIKLFISGQLRCQYWRYSFQCVYMDDEVFKRYSLASCATFYILLWIYTCFLCVSMSLPLQKIFFQQKVSMITSI